MSRRATVVMGPLLVALLLAISLPARGFVPLDPVASERFHVAQPLLEAQRLAPHMTAPPTSAEVAQVTAQLPGSWAVRWNRLTGTPHRIEGTGFDLVPGGFASAADVDRASRQFVDAHPELAGVSSEDLGLIAIDHAARHWSAIYEQTVSGIPMEGARIDFLYSESGRLLSFGSDAHRRVPPSARSHSPRRRRSRPGPWGSRRRHRPGLPRCACCRSRLNFRARRSSRSCSISPIAWCSRPPPRSAAG